MVTFWPSMSRTVVSPPGKCESLRWTLIELQRQDRANHDLIARVETIASNCSRLLCSARLRSPKAWAR